MQNKMLEEVIRKAQGTGSAKTSITDKAVGGLIDVFMFFSPLTTRIAPRLAFYV